MMKKIILYAVILFIISLKIIPISADIVNNSDVYDKINFTGNDTNTHAVFENDMFKLDSMIDGDCLSAVECAGFCLSNTINTFSQKFIYLIIMVFLTLAGNLLGMFFATEKKDKILFCVCSGLCLLGLVLLVM